METRLHVDRFEEMLELGVEGCRVLKEEMEGVVKAWTSKTVERMEIGMRAGTRVTEA
jgi:exosome complex component RRP41